MAVLGSTGLRRQGGIIYEEPLRDLTGRRWVDAVRDMTYNDATVGAILFAVEMLIRQVQWSVEPASDAAEDVEAADFVTECLHGMGDTWEDTLSAILSMLPWGWSLHEVVYTRRDDGRIGWGGWPIRAQDTLYEWQFDEAGRVVAMVQQAPPDFAIRVIPLDRALLFRTTAAKGNPEGFSMLRRAWRAWNAKRRIENLEGIGIERDLAGRDGVAGDIERVAEAVALHDLAAIEHPDIAFVLPAEAVFGEVDRRASVQMRLQGGHGGFDVLGVDAADAQSRHRGDAAYANLPIDPYASENPAEFFAVMSEAFFETPDLVREDYPKVYGQLKLFYKQDPLARLAG
jgi:hypothetical protein